MPHLELKLTREQFDRLPRNAAYRYELLGGQAFLTPRPRHFHALLDLGPIEGVDTRPLRRVRPGDWDVLPAVFAAAFRGVQPFGSLTDEEREKAARECLERTLAGGDGPLIERASFVATDEERGALVGAILVTLLPAGDPCDGDSYYWREPPPADAVERRLGRPHLTWVFVSPHEAGRGVGTALLAAAVCELRALGYAELATTFLLGNDSSMLWHWRNGFRLLPHPVSRRVMKQRQEARKK